MKKLIKINIVNPPVVTEFLDWERINFYGLIVSASYDDGSEEPIEDPYLEFDILDTPGTSSICKVYKSKEEKDVYASFEYSLIADNDEVNKNTGILLAATCSNNLSCRTTCSGPSLGFCTVSGGSCCSASTDCSSSADQGCGCSSCSGCTNSSSCGTSYERACGCSSYDNCCSGSSDCNASFDRGCGCSSYDTCCSGSTDCSSSSERNCGCSSYDNCCSGSLDCSSSLERACGCTSYACCTGSSDCSNSSEEACGCNSTQTCNCTSSGLSACATCPSSGSATTKDINIEIKDTEGRLFQVENVTNLNIDGTTKTVGIEYYRSDNTANSTTSEITSNSVSLNSGDKITIDYYVLSEATHDKLNIYFYKDGSQVDSLTDSGYNSGWSTKTYNVTSSGSYSIKVQYVKDGSVSGGADRAWVRRPYYNIDGVNYLFTFTNTGSYGFTELRYQIIGQSGGGGPVAP